MKILLDTHIIIWVLMDSPKLSPKARELILDRGNEIYFSVISLWEIETKRLSKPDKMPFTARDISDYCKRAGYKLIQLKEESIYKLSELTRPENEPVHKDPFDRMLICQAMTENMNLFTHNSLIKGYDVSNILLV